jgi:hypothetical protein
VVTDLGRRAVKAIDPGPGSDDDHQPRGRAIRERPESRRPRNGFVYFWIVAWAPEAGRQYI